MRPVAPTLMAAVALAVAAPTPGEPPRAADPASGSPAAPSAPARAVPAKPPAVGREGIEALEAQLDRAVDRVSVPQLLPLVGRPGSARGYRLPGYGLVIVLSPRALPGPEGLDVLRPRQRVRVEARRGGDTAVWVEAPEAIEALERQVILLQRETERARREAEEVQERIVEHVRVRSPRPAEVTVELLPEPPAPAAAPEAPSPGQPPGAAAEAPPPPPSVPPPWKYWFHAEEARDPRSADAVVADVRAAVIEALGAHPPRMRGLGPEEFVTVAVDFESGGRLARHPRAERTLVVRAKVRDIQARAGGALDAAELRRRIEVLEY